MTFIGTMLLVIVNSRLAIVHHRGLVTYSGLVMITTLVCNVYLGMCIVEMTSVVVIHRRGR